MRLLLTNNWFEEVDEENEDRMENFYTPFQVHLRLKIPVDKFRWQWKVKNSMLILNGKANVLRDLKPIIKPYGDLKYIEPDTNNKRLYAMK